MVGFLELNKQDKRNDDTSLHACKVSTLLEESGDMHSASSVASDNSVSECNNDILI